MRIVLVVGMTVGVMVLGQVLGLGGAAMAGEGGGAPFAQRVPLTTTRVGAGAVRQHVQARPAPRRRAVGRVRAHMPGN